VSAARLDAYARDGFLGWKAFLSSADWNALQASAAELVDKLRYGPVRSIFFFDARPGPCGERYFQESGGPPSDFFFEGTRPTSRCRWR